MNRSVACASFFLPPWISRRELDRIARATTAALDVLLAQRAPESLDAIRRDERLPRRVSGRGLAGRRAAMAQAHNARVAALCGVCGEDGIRLARQALFRVGVELGQEARHALKVRNTERDLLGAARLLYRILGIRFRAESTGQNRALVSIDRCALSSVYSPEACLALSAVDEGVVAGLHPGARLRFVERMTEGKATCQAWLEIRTGEERHEG